MTSSSDQHLAKYLVCRTFYSLLEEADPEQTQDNWTDSPYFGTSNKQLDPAAKKLSGLHVEVAIFRVGEGGKAEADTPLRVLRSWNAKERDALRVACASSEGEVRFRPEELARIPLEGLAVSNLPALLIAREWVEGDAEHVAFVRLHNRCGRCSPWWRMAQTRIDYLDALGRITRDLPQHMPRPTIAGQVKHKTIELSDLGHRGVVPLAIKGGLAFTDRVPLRAVYVDGRKLDIAAADSAVASRRNRFRVTVSPPPSRGSRTVAMKREVLADGTYSYVVEEEIALEPATVGAPRVEVVAENLLGARARAVVVYTARYEDRRDERDQAKGQTGGETGSQVKVLAGTGTSAGASAPGDGKVRRYECDSTQLQQDGIPGPAAPVAVRYLPIPYFLPKLQTESTRGGKDRQYLPLAVAVGDGRAAVLRAYVDDSVTGPCLGAAMACPFDTEGNDNEVPTRTRRRRTDVEATLQEVAIDFATAGPVWQLQTDAVVIVPDALERNPGDVKEWTPGWNAITTFLPADLGMLLQVRDTWRHGDEEGARLRPPRLALPASTGAGFTGTLAGKADHTGVVSPRAVSAGVEAVSHATHTPLAAVKNGDVLRVRAVTLAIETRADVAQQSQSVTADTLDSNGAPPNVTYTLSARDHSSSQSQSAVVFADAVLTNCDEFGLADGEPRDEPTVTTRTKLSLTAGKWSPAGAAGASSASQSPPAVAHCLVSLSPARLITQEYLEKGSDVTSPVGTRTHQMLAWGYLRIDVGEADGARSTIDAPGGAVLYKDAAVTLPEWRSQAPGEGEQPAGEAQQTAETPVTYAPEGADLTDTSSPGPRVPPRAPALQLRGQVRSAEIIRRRFQGGWPSAQATLVGTTPRVGAPGTHRVGGLDHVLRDGSVYVHNGELALAAEDLSVPGRIQDVSFTRTHHALSLQTTDLGRNWDWLGSMRLVELPNGDVHLMTGQASVERYRPKTHQPAGPATKLPTLRMGKFCYQSLYDRTPYHSPPGAFRLLLRARPQRVGAEPDARLEPSRRPHTLPTPAHDEAEEDRFYLVGKHGTIWTFVADVRFQQPAWRGRTHSDSDDLPAGVLSQYLLAAVHDRRQSSCLRLQRDAAGFVTALVDDMGRITRLTHSGGIAADRRLASVVDFARRTVEFSYDNRNLQKALAPQTRTDPDLPRTERGMCLYAYDSQGQRGPTHRLAKVTLRQDKKILFENKAWDAAGRVTRQIMPSQTDSTPDGRRVEIVPATTYDFKYLGENNTQFERTYQAYRPNHGDKANRTDVQKFHLAGRGDPHVLTHTYLAPKQAGNNPLGTCRDDVATQYLYNDHGQVRQITFPRGNTRHVEFYSASQAGNVRSVRERGRAKKPVRRSDYEYDKRFNLPTQTKVKGYHEEGKPCQYRTAHLYDAHGQPLRRERLGPNSSPESFVHDPTWQVLTETTSVLGAVTRTEYFLGQTGTDAGNDKAAKGPNADKAAKARTSSAVGAADGRCAQPKRVMVVKGHGITPAHHKTRFDRDLLGQLTLAHLPDKSQETYQHSPLGLVLVDPQTRRYAYRHGYPAEQRTPIPKPRAGKSAGKPGGRNAGRNAGKDAGKDAASAKAKPPEYAVLRTTHSLLGDAVFTQLHDMKTLAEYDGDGNLLRQVDPAGTITQQVHDHRGLVTERTVKGNA